jgi:hypothetical protein
MALLAKAMEADLASPVVCWMFKNSVAGAMQMECHLLDSGVLSSVKCENSVIRARFGDLLA